MRRSALIVGCGYTGVRLAAHLLDAGVRVVGTTRSQDRAEALAAAGIEPLVGDLAAGVTRDRLSELGVQAVFYLVPPESDGADPLEAVLEAASGAGVGSLVYASSTSVYGDREGGWVDETTPVRPEGASAEARHAAERLVLEASDSTGLATRICRISGIYGPGRTLRRVLERGDYLLIRGRDTWVNRIHVEDLASGLVAAWQVGAAGEVFNLVDDEPHRGSDFALLAAELHGLPAPEWVDEGEARRRYGEARLRRKLQNKRVRNRRLREELGVDLAYPDYRSGLPAAIESERGRGRHEA